MYFFVISEYFIQQQFIMRAFHIINDSFHIENNRNIRAGAAFRNLLRMKLAGAIYDKFPFFQAVRMAVYFRHHASPVNIGKFEIGMFFASKLIAGIADGVIVSENLADSDAGKDSFKQIRWRKRFHGR